MDWFQPIDAYCERTDATFWAEPVNAATNLAFLAAALWAFAVWRRDGGSDRAGLALIAVTAIVGLGSFLFHTDATRWSALADVIPIALFIHGYFFLAMRRMLGLKALPAVLVTLAFAGASVLVARSLAPVLGSSAGYAGALMALVGVGLAVRGRDPASARRLFVGAGLFAVSLTARMLDMPLCDRVPLGTHFLWHLFNGLLLGWLTVAMIRARRSSDDGSPIEDRQPIADRQPIKDRRPPTSPAARL